jgi:hypothetical protein
MGVSRRLLNGFFVAALTFASGVGIVAVLGLHRRAMPEGVLTLTGSSEQNRVLAQSSAPCHTEISAINYAPVSSVRRIDFRNMDYPETICANMPTESFRLRRGLFGTTDFGMKLRSISFGDVSGDGNDEAIVAFDQLSDGSGSWNSVYVFALEQKQPKVIYVFETGDRAQGGLRTAFAEGGEFVLELWGPGNTLERTFGSDGTGLCCPWTFTRTRYQWLKQIFQQVGSPEILPNPRAEAQCPMCDH